MEEFIEGVGESSSPVKSSFAGGFDIRNEVYNRLIDNGNKEAVSDPEFRNHLNAHFNRLPARYVQDVNMDRVEDVLLHQKLLAQAKDPEKRPVFHVRFMEDIRIKPDRNDDIEQSTALASTSGTYFSAEVEGTMTSNYRQEVQHVSIHEIIFSTIDKPKLLSQLSALLSDIGLNIREAHVFSTTDGFSLDVFVVDGWSVEDTNGLREAVGKAVSRSEVVKVADFGVARFQKQDGTMTAETGTYRWMAPEVINHQAYDEKADVFSFGIVVWELTTAKIPYDRMTPLQAALGVRQGLRPDVPDNLHPRLLELMHRCWDAVSSNRPSFPEITLHLELLQHEIQQQ